MKKSETPGLLWQLMLSPAFLLFTSDWRYFCILSSTFCIGITALLPRILPKAGPDEPGKSRRQYPRRKAGETAVRHGRRRRRLQHHSVAVADSRPGGADP